MENNKDIKEQIVENLEPEEIRELREKITETEQEIEDLGDWEMNDEDLDNYLDDCWGEVDIAGLKYPFSRVLKDVDECRYAEFRTDIEGEERQRKTEELEEELEDLKNQLNELIGEEEEED